MVAMFTRGALAMNHAVPWARRHIYLQGLAMIDVFVEYFWRLDSVRAGANMRANSGMKTLSRLFWKCG
jgi:hypothetical protein